MPDGHLLQSRMDEINALLAVGGVDFGAAWRESMLPNGSHGAARRLGSPRLDTQRSWEEAALLLSVGGTVFSATLLLRCAVCPDGGGRRNGRKRFAAASPSPTQEPRRSPRLAVMFTRPGVASPLSREDDARQRSGGGHGYNLRQRVG